MPTSPTPRWLNTEQAAAYLGVSVSQIQRWRRARKIKPSKPSGLRGRCWYRPEDLDDFMESSRVT
jgi:excisionase family DNA binding protein